MTTTWTDIAKASGTSWTDITKPSTINLPKGSPIGLLMALTYATSLGTTWTDLAKASGTTWTDIPKAT